MIDVFDVQTRSRIMSCIRSKNNAATELRFIKILKKNKISGWRRNSKLIGKPDFVFLKVRVAVFIDGDFWHGNPKNFRLPKSNLAYWQKKVLSNRTRDRTVNRLLRSAGWTVLRIWQSRLADEKAVLCRLKRCIFPVSTC